MICTSSPFGIDSPCNLWVQIIFVEIALAAIFQEIIIIFCWNPVMIEHHMLICYSGIKLYLWSPILMIKFSEHCPWKNWWVAHQKTGICSIWSSLHLVLKLNTIWWQWFIINIPSKVIQWTMIQPHTSDLYRSLIITASWLGLFLLYCLFEHWTFLICQQEIIIVLTSYCLPMKEVIYLTVWQNLMNASDADLIEFHKAN